MKWFRFYSDAVDDPKVQRMPAELFKVWVNLLCIVSRNDGEMPSLDDTAYTLRMSVAELMAILETLAERGLMDVCDTGTMRPHNWDARQKASDTSALRVAKWRAGGDDLSNVTASLPQQSSDDLSNVTATSQIKTKRKTNTLPASGVEYGTEFEEFWQAYPRHVEKKQAHGVWLRLNPDATLRGRILDALARQKASEQWANPRYIPHATTWLNGARWEDEPEPASINRPITALPRFPSQADLNRGGTGKAVL